MTRGEIEKGVDELTRPVRGNPRPRGQRQTGTSGHRLAELLPKTFSIESTCTAAILVTLIQFKSLASLAQVAFLYPVLKLLHVVAIQPVASRKATACIDQKLMKIRVNL
jgi:hypothetical protein